MTYFDWAASSGSLISFGLGAPGRAVVGLSELLIVLAK